MQTRHGSWGEYSSLWENPRKMQVGARSAQCHNSGKAIEMETPDNRLVSAIRRRTVGGRLRSSIVARLRNAFYIYFAMRKTFLFFFLG